jgi:hypothetical protein
MVIFDDLVENEPPPIRSVLPSGETLPAFGRVRCLRWPDRWTRPSNVETSLPGALGGGQQDTAVPRPVRYYMYLAPSGYRMLITSLSNSLGSNPRISLSRGIFSRGISAFPDSMIPTKVPYRYLSILPSSAWVHPLASLACLILLPSFARPSLLMVTPLGCFEPKKKTGQGLSAGLPVPLGPP